MSHHFPHVTIIGVVDGDTIDVLIDFGFRLSQNHRVRLAGIDAPEVNAAGPEGEAARDWLRARLPVGLKVELETEKPADKYGRYLAWVFDPLLEGSSTGVPVNYEMVTAGHAKLYSGGAK